MQCEKLFNLIDELNEEYLNILEDVCNIESPTLNKEKVDEVGDYFIKMAEQKGWKTEVLKQEIAGNVVCITLNPNASKAPLSVSAHIDTVHPVGLFGNPPVKRDQDNMYGPGVMDCKGGAVAAFLAMDALEKAGFTDRPIQLLLQSDEETGSATSKKETIKYICEKAKGSVGFLNLEGYLNGSAVLIRKGILRYNLTVHGKALHSSRCTDGANAVLEAAHKIIKLEELKDPEGLTCNCGVISGGTVPNTVAEKCTFSVDIRFANGEELKKAREFVKEVVENSTVEGCTCEGEEISLRPAMEYAKENFKFLDKINEIYKANGLPELEARKCLSGSDAAYVTEAGIPCIDSIGTEGQYIHSVNEYIKLSSLKESAKRIAAVAYMIV